MKRFATGLLVAAAAVYVIARWLETAYPALGYLRAFCEAAMIGGLADWFAVTALFRHPLAIPLPHTAIIPRNKDRIGGALGRFVESNFLAADVVAQKLGQIDFADVTARWLADSSRSAPAIRRLADGLPRFLDALDSEPLRHFVRGTALEALERIELAPIAADVLDALLAGKRHHALIDELVDLAERFLAESESEIRDRVRARTAWLWQRIGVDAAISDRILAAMRDALAEVRADPEHPWRARLGELLRGYVEPLRTSPEWRERAERARRIALRNPAFGAYLAEFWSHLGARVRADLADPASLIRTRLQQAVIDLGERLLADDGVRAALNEGLRRALTGLVEKRRHEVAELIAHTVRRWDARTVTARIEAALGDDLQYIRINGTVIGGLVGVAIHALSEFLPR